MKFTVEVEARNFSDCMRKIHATDIVAPDVEIVCGDLRVDPRTVGDDLYFFDYLSEQNNTNKCVQL